MPITLTSNNDGFTITAETVVEVAMLYDHIVGDVITYENFEDKTDDVVNGPSPWIVADDAPVAVGPLLDDGWIAHNGGECPVDLDSVVEYKLRSHPIGSHSRGAKADLLMWKHHDKGYDIVAYRECK